MLKSFLGMFGPREPVEPTPTEGAAPANRTDEPSAKEGDVESLQGPGGPKTHFAHSAARKLAQEVEARALQKAKAAVKLASNDGAPKPTSDEFFARFEEIVSRVDACSTDELAEIARRGLGELQALLGLRPVVAVVDRPEPSPTADDDGLQRELADRERELQELQEEKAASVEEAAELQATIDDLRAEEEERKVRIAGMTAEIEALANEITDLNDSNEALEGELSTSKEELKAAEEQQLELRNRVTDWFQAFFQDIGGFHPNVSDEIEGAMDLGRAEISRLHAEIRWRRSEMTTVRDGLTKGAWRLARGPVRQAREWPDNPPTSKGGTEQ